MANIRVSLDRRVTVDGSVHPVKLGVSYRGRYMYVSLRMYVRGDQFDRSGGGNGMTWVCGHASADDYNSRIREAVVAADAGLRSVPRPCGVAAVRSAVRAHVQDALGIGADAGRDADRTSLLAVFGAFASTKTTRTREIYEATIKKVRRYAWKGMDVADVDTDWVRKFEGSLLAEGLAVNTVAIHMRNLRAVVNYAVGEGMASGYPFRRFVIRKEQTPKRSLTEAQLAEFRDWPCEDHQVRYRDIFMLSFYLLGINMVDLCNAMRSDVVNGRLEYRRTKTHKLYSVLVQPEAQAIIGRYAGREHLLFVLEEYGDYRDFMHRMNGNLQCIGEVKTGNRYNVKERKPLHPKITTYWARHTWATIAHRIGVPKDVISMALGHSFGVRVTDVYIDYDMEKVDEANRRVIDHLNAYGEEDIPTWT